jgi:chemotaxis protein CheD
MKLIVGVGDMKMGKKDDVLVTHALGSCLGLMIYDPRCQIGGLLHAMLPLSKINPQKAEANPYMFVDTGIPGMFKKLLGMGANRGEIVVKAAGCGTPMGNENMFKIGKRNFTVMKKLLWKNSIILKSDDVGGTISRTINFNLSSGDVIISCKGERWKL